MSDLSEARRTPSAPQSWEKTFANSVPALMQAIESLSEFLSLCSASPQALYHVQLVAEELGVNIIKYAYPDQQEHRIELRVECMPERFRLQILDDGVPFDVRHVSEPDPGQNLEDREPGGWGISLVRRVSRRIDYERREGMNVLTIEIAR